MRVFIEDTSDRGWEKKVHASNNNATYILTSAQMHDLYQDYVDRYGKLPTAAWYHRYAQFRGL